MYNSCTTLVKFIPYCVILFDSVVDGTAFLIFFLKFSPLVLIQLILVCSSCILQLCWIYYFKYFFLWKNYTYKIHIYTHIYMCIYIYIVVSLTQRTWVWVSSGNWWWTGKPGMLQSIGLQRVRRDWLTELNWLVEIILLLPFEFRCLLFLFLTWFP